MKSIWPIAAISFKEGIRNRALYGIFILAVLFFAATILMSGMVMHEVGKVAVDMALSAISFSGLLLVLFVGINLMAKDLDRKTIYMVLSRPVSRAQYIVGKFFGNSLLIIVAVFVLSIGGIASIGAVKLGHPSYFTNFTWSLVVLAIVLIIFKLILLSAISLFFASFASTSFVTLVLTVVTYLIGESIAGIKALVGAADVVGIKVSGLSASAIQFAYYCFPNLSFFNIKTQAAHGLPIELSYLFFVALYACVYSCLAIVLAVAVFSRREFP
ncbi:ABC transporter permease [uncultured Desulfuromusa sp.]|uniref:ABC transporter permease n=1 Tax=uncultured Desulfuromusa sp. TaxID=219183 RepID=UPI002AA89D77|nr:ABC transporter permease [uncultured Desulfuromusa sp.]